MGQGLSVLELALACSPLQVCENVYGVQILITRRFDEYSFQFLEIIKENLPFNLFLSLKMPVNEVALLVSI